MTLKILHLSTHDSGGAARSAYRLHQNLRKAGVNSFFLVRYKMLADDDIFRVSESYFFRIKRKLLSPFLKKRKFHSDKDYYFLNSAESISYFPTSSILRQVPFVPDVIIVHWISNFINSRNLYELNRLTKAPILSYFHDMSHYTGGCHYFWDCRNFLTHCGNCPALNSKVLKDMAYDNFSFKKKYLSRTNLFPMVGTFYAQNLLEKSSLYSGKKSLHLPAGVDADIFCPPPKKDQLRELYNIPKDARVILFASSSFHEKRKGISFTLESLDNLHRDEDYVHKQNTFVLVAGDAPKEVLSRIPFKYLPLGFLTTEKALATAYQLSDVFLCTILEDAGPMMVAESLMCGVPLVGFDVGLITDLIKNGETGYKVEKQNVKELSICLNKILTKSEVEVETMSEKCRQIALEFFHPQQQVNRILNFIPTLKS